MSRERNASTDVRLEDVARLADVSIASVSRVLNGTARVGDELRRKVESAIGRLNYVPHGAARALASRRSQTIGAVVPTVDNAIFARAISAFQARLSEDGFTLLLASSGYDLRTELAAAKALVERGVDALMLVGTLHDAALLRLLDGKGIPYVNTWALDPSDRVPCVGFDNIGAMEKIVGYLHDLGHARFAMLAGVTAGNDRAQARVEGFRNALRRRRVDPGPVPVVECPYDIAEARIATRQLLRRRPRPSAIVCGNDILALGVLFECQSQGVPVPQAVSVTGFDDLELVQHLTPSLTTMRVPSDAMGRQAADYLLGWLNGRRTTRCLELEASLVVRESTAPPRAGRGA